MADDGHVVFALGAFSLIEGMKRRVFESSNRRDEPDRPAQVGRTAFGHLHASAREVTGLVSVNPAGGKKHTVCRVDV